MSDETSTPPQPGAQEPSRKKPWPGAAYLKPITGRDDPRRMNGRPKGLPNKCNRGARAVFEAHQSEVAEQLLELTKETKADPEPCPFCRRGMLRDENIRVKAMESVLDRGGTPRVTGVEVSGADDNAWLEYATAAEAQAVLDIIEACQARMPINVGRAASDDPESLM